MENTSSRGAVNHHEQESNCVAQKEHNDKWANRWVNLLIHGRPESDDSVANWCGCDADSQFAEHVKDAANSSGEGKSCGVFQDQQESIDCGSAEVFAS